MKVWFCVRFPGEPKTPAVSLVTVWAASEVLSHSTCVPALIESVPGWKEYTPFVSIIFAVTTFEVRVGVGLGCDVGVAVGCNVAVGVEVVVVPPPPQAANRSAATIANKRNAQNKRARLANDDGYLFMT